MAYVILTAWSVSLTQFTLILTATSSKKRRVTHSLETNIMVKVKQKCNCMHNEIWAILVSVVLQDAPFLTIRLYVATKLHVITFPLIFFTIKNIVVILLQWYRLVVVACHKQEVSGYNIEENFVEEIPLSKDRNGKSNNTFHITENENKDNNDKYGTFYNENAAFAKKHDLKAGAAPIVNTEQTF